jgi:DNA-binding FadR family transcriptional regulator
VRRTAAQLQALTQACAHFERDAADTEAAVAAVVEFFTAVAVASGNQVLALSQASLNVLLAPALTRMLDRIPQARGRIREAQARITAAIELKKSEQARSWMEKHIADFRRGHELERAPKAAMKR